MTTPIVLTALSQKVARITLSATETDYQINASALKHLAAQIVLTFSVASLYHSILGSAATDGFPIPAGGQLVLTVQDQMQFGVCTVTGAGNLDILVQAVP